MANSNRSPLKILEKMERGRIEGRDSNSGPVFSIPGFGIGEFLIPRSRQDYGIPAV